MHVEYMTTMPVSDTGLSSPDTIANISVYVIVLNLWQLFTQISQRSSVLHILTLYNMSDSCKIFKYINEMLMDSSFVLFTSCFCYFGEGFDRTLERHASIFQMDGTCTMFDL